MSLSVVIITENMRGITGRLALSIKKTCSVSGFSIIVFRNLVYVPIIKTELNRFLLL